MTPLLVTVQSRLMRFMLLSLGMAEGKSPGSDGLPMEFYVVFWDLLSEDLVNVFNASL